MEMYQVRYFLSVARALNFTRAAEECEVAQPSLSRAIKQLEAELGGELFRRERPQAILTELGHKMLPILARCYESANSARALAAAVRKGDAGTLNVALSPTIPLDLPLSRFGELKRVFNGLAVAIRRAQASEALEGVKTGRADLALAAADEPQTPLLERHKLFDEGFHLICSRMHKLANTASVRADDLCEEQFILPRHGEHSDQLAAWLQKVKVRLETCHEAFSDADMLGMASSGLGLAIAPVSLAARNGVVAIPVEGLDLRRTVFLYGAAGRPRSAPASTLMNMLRAANWQIAANA
jgi:DNA-binding transcriptional LysR family regulator